VESLIFLSIFGTSVLMLLFLLFDFCFSSSVRYYTKKSTRYDKKEKYKIFEVPFSDVKNRFNRQDVELYINKSNEINAFAVGSLRKNIIVLTTGLINHYYDKLKDKDTFLLSIEGIIGHEMSHIVNRDYFTALLMLVNERALAFISKLVLLFFNIFIRIISIIPTVGYYIGYGISSVYKIFDSVISFFFKHVMMKIYKFIQLQISKSIEYRADEQGAKVVGGQNMADALSLLGESGFFTIFSSHPSTKNRINNVKSIEISENMVKPVFGSGITFLLSFIIIIFTSYSTLKLANIPSLVSDYNSLLNYFVSKYVFIMGKIAIYFNM
jgi:Zn-dependent protease with chaperone function